MQKWSCVLFIFVFYCSICIPTAHCDRVHQKIYVQIESVAACYRFLNATHQIGCSSDRGGNVGVLHYVNSTEELNWLLRFKAENAPYVVLMTARSFTELNIKLLVKSKKVNGILVYYDNATTSPAFSPDSTCPNSGYGRYTQNSLYANCKAMTWNPTGNHLMLEDFDMPIMALLNRTEVEYLITECYEKFNKQEVDRPHAYPLCAVEVKDVMDGARNTPSCMRRSQMVTNLNPQRYCDPLGDVNVHSLLHALNSSKPLQKASVIIAATRRDTRSMFSGLTPAADSTVGGIVTLLAAAQAIGRVKERISATDKPIMFTFFNGEAFDYIGSSRMVYEMMRNNFPAERKDPIKDPVPAVEPHLIKLDDIYSIVEVGQVALQRDHQFWIHSDPLTAGPGASNHKTVQHLTKVLKQAAASTGVVRISAVPRSQPLPPASLQSFLRENSVPGVLISEHQRQFTNLNYQGRFDTARSLGSTNFTQLAGRIQPLATTLARALYTLSTGRSDSENITANTDTISDLLYCFLQSAQCDMFNHSFEADTAELILSKTPLSLFVGVWPSWSITKKSGLSFVIHNLLAYFLGDVVSNRTQTSCGELSSPLHKFIWMQGAPSDGEGICVKTTANFSVAKSPAFDIDDYDWSLNRYSSWAESSWGDDSQIGVRVFLLPSPSRELTTLLVGVAVAIAAFFLTYLLHCFAAGLFTPLQQQLLGEPSASL